MNIPYNLRRLIKKIFGDKIFVVYETKVGIKNINLGRASLLEKPAFYQKITLPAKELYFGPDFLKDQYTLLGTNIFDSPHYKYMKSLALGENLEKCEYIVRKKRGTLDWRDAEKVKDTFYEQAKEIYKHKYSHIKDACRPVIVYAVKGKYYIYDGKHRAALCAYWGKAVDCIEVGYDCVASYYGKYLFDLLADKPEYDKHRIFMREIKEQDDVKIT